MRTNKILLVICLFLLSLSLVACKETTTVTTNSIGDLEYEYTQPSISNPETVVYTKDNISLTKADIYKALKLNGGMDQLLLAVDEKMLADKISTITTDSEAYKTRYNRIVYGTDDLDEINNLENKEEKERIFNTSLDLLGYTTQADKERYMKVLVAREQTAYEYMKVDAKLDSHGSFYYTISTVQNFYGSTKNVDQTAKAIVINYKSMNEFYDALATIDGNIALYNGKFYKNPNNVAKRNYSEETLTAVTTDEAKAIFESLYAYQYGAYTEANEYEYNTLQSKAPAFANTLFDLNKDEYTYIATKNTVEYGDVFTLCYRTEGQAKGEWKTLTAEEKAQAEDDFCKYITKSGQYTTTIMGLVRRDKNIEFLDMSFGYKYFTTYCGTYKFDTHGDESVLVKWDGGQLTADEYYEYSTAKNVGYYAIYAAMPKLVETTAYYSLAYGTNKDLATNASLRKAEYTKAVLTDLNSNFVESQMHLKSVYLYDKYGVETVEDAVIFNKIVPDFQYLIALENLGTVSDDELTLNADAATKLGNLITNDYAGYYKIRVYELSISLDNDQDYVRDDGAQYNHDDVDALVSIIKEEIYKDDKGNDSDAELSSTTLAERMERIIGAYNDPAKDTSNLFTALRKKNFILGYTGINAGNQLERITYKDNCTEEMNTALKNAYTTILEDPENPGSEVAYPYNTVVYDKDGAHVLFIFGASSKPSYKLEETGDYSEKFLNDSDKMTTEQLGQAYYVYTFKQLFKDADTASSTYGVSNYPESPSSLSFDSYSSVIASYYASDSYSDIYYINKLVGGSDATISAQLQSYIEAMNVFLDDVEDFSLLVA